MIQFFSQFIQQMGGNPSDPQNKIQLGGNFQGNRGENTFAQTLMGFLGMGKTGDSAQQSAGILNGKTVVTDNADGSNPEELSAQLTPFPGSHFVHMKQQGAASLQGSGKEEPTDGLPTSSEADNMQIRTDANDEVFIGAKLLSNGIEAASKEGGVKVKGTQAGNKTPATIQEDNNGGQAILGSSNSTNAEGKPVPMSSQTVLANFPGASVSAAAQEVVSPDVDTAVKFTEKQVTQNGSGGGKASNTNGSIILNGSSTAGQQKAAGSSASHPLKAHLRQQPGKMMELDGASEEAKKQAQSSGTKGSTSRHATKNTGWVNPAKSQNLAAFSSGDTSFRPLQNQSFSFMEMDSAKLSKVESGSDIDMELQSGNEKGQSSKENSNASMRMGGNTISLLSKAGGRRDFSAQLVRHLNNAESNSAAGENWSHHRFVLDDGNSINVAVRHADGAMQLQLSAGNSELNKIIQQHIDEIRQHLQEQMELEIDLQLQDFGREQAGEGGESQSGSFGPEVGFGSAGEMNFEEQKSGQRAARYLGFNNNEWTA